MKMPTVRGLYYTVTVTLQENTVSNHFVRFNEWIAVGSLANNAQSWQSQPGHYLQ